MGERERERHGEKSEAERAELGFWCFISFISIPDHPSDQRLTIFWT
jgi:hypothetical protein